jgi:hypothetical protein
MPHHLFLFVRCNRVLPRCEREAMIDQDTKMPIAGSCDDSILSRSSAHYPSRSLPGADLALIGRPFRGAAPGPVGNPFFSSLLVTDNIRPNQPGPPLL